MVGMIFKFNQPQPWLLTANVKETTVKSIGNARSVQIQSVRVSAMTRQSTTFSRYLMTFPISDAW